MDGTQPILSEFEEVHKICPFLILPFSPNSLINCSFPDSRVRPLFCFASGNVQKNGRAVAAVGDAG